MLSQKIAYKRPLSHATVPYVIDGKAYDFYMQKVAPDDPMNWGLHRFFAELYNYCFPIDYKQQTRLRLEALY